MIYTTTERLRLREMDERDAQNIHLLNSDPEVLKYVHDVPFKDVDAARTWIADIGKQLPLGIGRWAIELNDGTWIGRCSLRRQTNGEVLMGYRLLREHWGKGYASEASAAMLRMAFDHHRLPYVLSHIVKRNAGSIRVAEKNGGYLWKEEFRDYAPDGLYYRFDAPGR